MIRRGTMEADLLQSLETWKENSRDILQKGEDAMDASNFGNNELNVIFQQYHQQLEQSDYRRPLLEKKPMHTLKIGSVDILHIKPFIFS